MHFLPRSLWESLNSLQFPIAMVMVEEGWRRPPFLSTNCLDNEDVNQGGQKMAMRALSIDDLLTPPFT